MAGTSVVHRLRTWRDALDDLIRGGRDFDSFRVQTVEVEGIEPNRLVAQADFYYYGEGFPTRREGIPDFASPAPRSRFLGEVALAYDGVACGACIISARHYVAYTSHPPEKGTRDVLAGIANLCGFMPRRNRRAVDWLEFVHGLAWNPTSYPGYVAERVVPWHLCEVGEAGRFGGSPFDGDEVALPDVFDDLIVEGIREPAVFVSKLPRALSASALAVDAILDGSVAFDPLPVHLALDGEALSLAKSSLIRERGVCVEYFEAKRAELIRALGRNRPIVDPPRQVTAEYRNDATLKGDPPSTETGAEQGQWLVKAMLTVHDHPDWSDSQIADSVGKHRGTLSRSPVYREAARLARLPRKELVRGFHEKDDEGRTSIEAVASPQVVSTDRDGREPAGTPLPGSNFVREYCPECDEAIRVRSSDVGKGKRCEGCCD